MQLSSHNEQLCLWSSGAIHVRSGRNFVLGTQTQETTRRTFGLHDNCQNTILLTRLARFCTLYFWHTFRTLTLHTLKAWPAVSAAAPYPRG